MGDVARVDFAYQEPRARLRFKGEPSLAFNIVREAGANVIETMEAVQEVLAELAEGPVAAAVDGFERAHVGGGDEAGPVRAEVVG